MRVESAAERDPARRGPCAARQGGRAALLLRAARRPRGEALCAGRACDRACDLRRLAAAGRGMAACARHRDHRPDHHLPLRARPRRAGGAGRRRRRPVPARAHPQFRRGARASRRDRYGRVRQDGHADPAAPDPRQRRRHRGRRPRARGLAGACEPAPAGQGRRRSGRGQRADGRPGIPGSGRQRDASRRTRQARLRAVVQRRSRGGAGRRRMAGRFADRAEDAGTRRRLCGEAGLAPRCDRGRRRGGARLRGRDPLGRP